MALTITKKLPNGQPDTYGGFSYAQVADITFDSSYASGGEALTPGDLGFPPGSSVVFFRAEPASGYQFEFDRTNNKLKCRVPSIVVGAAGSATLDDFALTGTGATTARSVGLDNGAASSTVRLGPNQEVASTTDLSTVTTRIFAVAAFV